MRTNEEYDLEKSRVIDFIIENLNSLDKIKLKQILTNEIPLSTLTPIYALALEGKVIHPENTIQNVVTSETIDELRAQIGQVQTDLIENISLLEQRIRSLESKMERT